MDADDTKAHGGGGAQLFSWGANSYGQLGLKHQVDISEPHLVDENITNLKSITGGGGHSVLLSENGQLFISGCNEKGQLGLETQNRCSSSSFEKVLPLNEVILTQVACGWDFTLAVCSSGQVYSWGSNLYGQLGTGNINSFSETPTKIDFLDNVKIIQISSGLRHITCIDFNGEIWGWGDCKKGQCPTQLKTTKYLNKPAKINLPPDKRFVEVSCGAFHTIALSTDGYAYGWGSNHKGQLATDPVNNVILPVTLLSNIPKLKFLTSGWSHVLGITADFKVVSWGRGDYGQLGRACPHVGYDFEPKLVDTKDQPIIQVCCGSEHSLAITKDGILLSWGWNEHGMCGNGNEINTLLPTPVKTADGSRPNDKCTLIGSGAGHSFAYYAML